MFSIYHNSTIRLVNRTACSMMILISALMLSACQTMTSPNTAPPVTSQPQADKTIRFQISGKIGVTSPATAEKPAQAGSAFYAWGQEDKRFTIEMTGALGIGRTVIEYDGRTANLTSEKTGNITADSPEQLLLQATGWQAPISQLPYWIMGKNAPSYDVTSRLFDDAHRLKSAKNGDWSAHFFYRKTETLPNKLIIENPQGYRVVLTINHQAMPN